ncbi:hypothetical protein LK459_03880 [Gordonia otitidis]|uniref:hypothetical protein n=1 Tax=Gordonia otitidis TaxID=249058 RepID=UPI001D15267E|nr:hypothetical protein [Gordonia otitidis]UEA60032.1 hypothetical protein LK459_03880 [Gordonia otitidis]
MDEAACGGWYIEFFGESLSAVGVLEVGSVDADPLAELVELLLVDSKITSKTRTGELLDAVLDERVLRRAVADGPI